MMKSIVFSGFIFVTTLFGSSLSAQQQQPPPPVPASVFPLGGLNMGGVGLDQTKADWNTKLPALGLNSLFYCNPTLVPNLTNGITVYPDFDLSLFLNCVDFNFDLASNEKPTELAEPPWDLAFTGWVTYRPIQLAGSGNLESYIASQVGDPVGTVYLDASDMNALPGYSAADGADFLRGGSVVYLDFASRIDQSRYNDGDEVCEIDVTAHYSEVETAVSNGVSTTQTNTMAKTKTSVIHKEDYNSTTGYYSTGYGSSHWGNDFKTEIEFVKNFPSKIFYPHPTPNGYSVSRLEFDLSEVGFDSTHTITTSTGSFSVITTLTSIDFTLKKAANSHGIFVRGVRVRPQITDWLLRGKLDNKLSPSSSVQPFPDGTKDGLYQRFYNLDTMKDANGGDWWQQSKGLFIWGEKLGDGNCHAYAHINELWRNWTKSRGGQKELYSILVPPFRTFRAIYEDYTGGVPPPAEQEQEILFELGRWDNGDHNYYFPSQPPDHPPYPAGPVYPGDAIPSSVKNHIGQNGQRDYIELNTLVTGWNGTRYDYTHPGTGMSLTPVGKGGSTWREIAMNSYQGYTQFFQNEYADGYVWSAPSGAAGWWTDAQAPAWYEGPYYFAAQGCYSKGVDPSLWTSFWAYPRSRRKTRSHCIGK